MHLENIENLKSLWTLVASKTDSHYQGRWFDYSYAKGIYWPNRLWFKEKVAVEILEEAKAILKGKGLTVPNWFPIESESKVRLEAYGFSLLYEQTGMSLNLNKEIKAVAEVNLIRVQSKDEGSLWSTLFNQSFGYVISKDTITRTCDHLLYFTAFFKGIAVGTAILHVTDGIAGIHAMGIIPTWQRKGLGKSLMINLLGYAQSIEAKTAELQASEAGKKLYLNLGFKSHSIIQNYSLMGKE